MNIIVTGAGRGLGLELAKRLAVEPGNQVIAVSRNIKALDDWLAGAHRSLVLGELHPFSFDLARGDYGELLQFARLHTDRVDGLLNNAGALVNKPFHEISDEEYDRVFDVNMKGAFRMLRTFYPMLGKGSHVVNITSMGGYQGSVKYPGLSVYSASKGALATFTECLAEELKEKGVSVNALALGSVQTEMLAEAFPGYRAPVTAEAMADFVAGFLLTGHRYFNGKVIPVALSNP